MAIERRNFTEGGDGNKRKYRRRVEDRVIERLGTLEKNYTKIAQKITCIQDNMATNTKVIMEVKTGQQDMADLLRLYLQAKEVGKFISAFWRFMEWLRARLQKILLLVATFGAAIAAFREGGIGGAIAALKELF